VNLKIFNSIGINLDLMAYCEFRRGDPNAQYENQRLNSLGIVFSGADTKTLYGQDAVDLWSELSQLSKF
jgi:hypothetical protein